ncbi:MAG: DsrE family protein [Spirochaetales bacterium]|nr:DsrE family protein [Spirochaetales bacterium]
MDKVVLFAFNGDPMCFTHVLLNALDFNDRLFEVKVVIEGSATGLVAALGAPDHPLHGLYEQVKETVLLVGVCKACSAKTGTLEAARAQGLHLLEEMSGHPSIASFMEQGYKVITF